MRNERGDRFADFGASNDMVITNTTVKHHPRRLYTWISPGDRIRNQIDYSMVPKRWQSSIQNVKTRPGADCGSDHQMLVFKLKLKLKSMNRTSAPVRYDVSSIPEEFKVEVSNKFKALQELDEPETTPDGLWESMKGIMKTPAGNNMPKRRKLKQQWLSQEAMGITDERRNAKNMQDNDESRRKDKLFTRKANEDKNRYLEDMCLGLERSGSDSRRVFQFLKKITHKRTALMDVLNDKEGKALTQDDEIKKRWAEYCEYLYKKPQDDNSDLHHTGNENEQPPLRDEIRQALNQLANWKSTGVDEPPRSFGRQPETKNLV